MSVQANEKFGEWIERGWRLFKANATVLILSYLVFFAITLLTGGILAGPMMAGLILVTLRLARASEPEPEVKVVFEGFQYFLQTFLYVLVIFALVLAAFLLVGWVPCVGQVLVPLIGVAVGTATMFALFLIVDKNMEFWPATLLSWKTVKPQFLPFLGFMFVTLLMASAGVIACCVGVVVTGPMAFCMMTVAYLDVFEDSPADSDEEASSDDVADSEPVVEEVAPDEVKPPEGE